MKFLTLTAQCALVCALSLAPKTSNGACPSIAEPVHNTNPGSQPLQARDLVKLHDIGPNYSTDPTVPILRVSPTGQRIAFQMHTADVETNGYCVGMYVLDLKAGAAPVLVNEGGDLIKAVYSVLGYVEHTPPGSMQTITPKWSPDGQWIAFLRRDNGSTQVWRAEVRGGNTEAVTHFDFDVLDFEWSIDGRSIIISGRPELETAKLRLQQEATEGYLYDDRFEPISSFTPMIREPIPIEHFAVRVDTRLAVAATAEESALLDSKPKISASSDGKSVDIEKDEPDRVVSPSRPVIRSGSDIVARCLSENCVNPNQVWWSKDGKSIYIQRRGGWAFSQTWLVRWDVASGRVKPILQTEDVLIGCQKIGSADVLVCAHESSVQPRHLVSVNLRDGSQVELFDPNPEFKQFKLGRVERLKWKSAFGTEAFGDLVLPPDHRAGDRHPLVVVGYSSLGFLRGGTGDDYPIHAFANRGFAVLAFNNPSSIGFYEKAKSWEEINRLDREDWAERRRVLSALEAGVSTAVATSTIDTSRIGLTGFSDGASTAQFAMLHSHLFRAVAVSNCCDTSQNMTNLYGWPVQEWFHKMGYPSYFEDGKAFWKDMSLSVNAESINTPLLMQLADREYMSSLEAFTALKEKNKPVEMYVYPDEFHVKWQPKHRLASYTRSLDWFDFWLRGAEDPDPGKTAQYNRWQSMQHALAEKGTISP